MEEVEYLCNRIGIMDQGQLIALGTKQDLYNRLVSDSGMSVKSLEAKRLNLEVKEPNLEALFLELTGQTLRD